MRDNLELRPFPIGDLDLMLSFPGCTSSWNLRSSRGGCAARCEEFELPIVQSRAGSVVTNGQLPRYKAVMV